LPIREFGASLTGGSPGVCPSLAYVDLVLKDGGRVRYVRTSPGSSHEGAEFVHTATPTEFLMSRLRWSGETWDIELRNGSRYRFPPCHEARYQGRICGPIEIRDGGGHRLELRGAHQRIRELERLLGKTRRRSSKNSVVAQRVRTVTPCSPGMRR